MDILRLTQQVKPVNALQAAALYMSLAVNVDFTNMSERGVQPSE